MKQVALVAGELSGDLLGAGLYREMTALQSCFAYGVAGEQMRLAGVEALFDIDALSVMGFSAVLKALPRILRLRSHLCRTLYRRRPDCYVGIDAPDFNLGVARRLKARGIKTVQYVSPTIWAWRPGRVHRIMAATDMVLCVFPFEPSLYTCHGHRAVYVGHPLADQIPMDPDKQAARLTVGVPESGSVVAILPGSRGAEWVSHLSLFLDAAQLIRASDASVRFILPLAKDHLAFRLGEFQERLDFLGIDVLPAGSCTAALVAADAAMVVSGTATLEAMLCKTPMVVGYRTGWFNYVLAKCLVKTPYIALPNILAGRRVVDELIQGDCTASALAQRILALLSGGAAHDEMLAVFSEQHAQLRCGADKRAAEAVLSLMASK